MENGPETITAEFVPGAPAVTANPTPAPAPAAFTGKPGNFAADMAALAAEQAPTVVPQPEVKPEAQAQPETTTPAVAPVTVPEKFKGPDGGLDAAKVEKSTLDAEAALAKYAAKEKELRQKMNEVNALSRQTIQPNVAPVVPEATQAPLTAFEIQVANDLIREAAAYGYQMPQGQAIAQARVQVKMAEARHQAEASLTETLRVKLEDQDRRAELEAIAKHDDRVLSPEGIEALSKIRDSNPWVNNSPKPWTEAYRLYLADQVMSSRLNGTVLPTPTGLTAKAPPTPVGPAPRAVVQPTAPALETPEQIEAHIRSFNGDRAKEDAFWASRGLRMRR